MRDRLRRLLLERSYAERPVVLSSGKESDWFIDCKQAVLTAEGHALAGGLLLDALRAFSTPPVAVAGVALGGCSLASAVSLLSWQRGAGGDGEALDAIYVRKETKEHGSQRRLEGDGSLREGQAVALVEDVITTGGSTLRAAAVLRERGLVLVGVAALVDREEGGVAALREAGLEVAALFNRSDFRASSGFRAS